MSVRNRLRSVRGRQLTPVLVVVATTVLVGVVNLVWLYHFRRGLPLDIDETGYLQFAFSDLDGWNASGPGGLHDALLEQRFTGPLVPLGGAVVLGLVGDRPIAAMAIQFVFLAVLAAATFGLGTAVRGKTAGAIAAVATLLSPLVIDWSRTFHFAVAVTAFMCLATCALARSDGLQRTGWAATAGAATGLMLLSRVYAIAFVPALVLAVLVLVWSGPGPRLRALRNACVGGLVALAVAGWWWIPNRAAIYDYLTEYTYGSTAEAYVNDHDSAITSPSFWTIRASELVSDGLFLGATLVFVVAALWWAWTKHRDRGEADETTPAVERALAAFATPTGVTATVLAASYLALTSVRHEGFGFIAPLLPLAVVVGVWFIWGHERQTKLVLASALVATLGLVAIGKTFVGGPLGTFRCVDLPVLEDCAPVTDGSSLEATSSDPDSARDDELGQWARAPGEAATRITEAGAAAPGSSTVVFFGSRDPLVNTNSLALAWRVQTGTRLAVGQLSASDGDTVANYVEQLRDPARGQPTMLITSPPGEDEFAPYVTQQRAEQAAECLGFELVDSWTLPDGREMRLHQRSEPLPPADVADRCAGV